jgi:membrane peptidoglycan carboxypeptidase
MRCDGKRVPADGWHPKNYTDESEDGSFGVITMREALRRSVNTYYAQLEAKVGLCDVVTMATAAGIHRADGLPQMEFLPYTLGINPVSPLDVADSYATIAARGLRCDPIAIESIAGHDGRALPVPSANCKQTIKPEVADVGVDLLRSVMEKGGYGYKMQLGDYSCLGKPTSCDFEKYADINNLPAKTEPRAAGGKTGTTNNSVAVWYTGITPQLATSVWMGDPDSYNFVMDDVTIGGTFWPVVSGSRIPGPIWKDMMNGALKGEPVLTFHPPSNKWLRGTKGTGASGPGKMTYTAGQLNTPKAGDIPAAPTGRKDGE